MKQNEPDPVEPTPDQCSTNAQVADWHGRKCFAIWYPQMGGYVSKGVIVTDGEGCFDAFIWHDGAFPFSDDGYDNGNSPAFIHHCSAEQFIEFGRQVCKMQGINPDEEN